MATNADFDALIVRITTATNTLETDVATITAGADNVQESVAAAQLAEANAEAAATNAQGQVTLAADQVALATTQAGNAASSASQAQALVTELEAAVIIQEAPEDNQTYGRNNGDWVVVTGGGGGGAVDSVNGETGVVVLDAADVGAKPASYVPTWTEVTGKPTTFAPITGTAANQAMPGNTVIPTNTNQLTNGAGFVTAADAPVRSVAGKTGVVTLAAADIASGVFAPARLGTGTPTADLVLKGDGTWGSAPASTAGYPIPSIGYNDGSGAVNITAWPHANPNQAAQLSFFGTYIEGDYVEGAALMATQAGVNALPIGNYWFPAGAFTGTAFASQPGNVEIKKASGTNQVAIVTTFTNPVNEYIWTISGTTVTWRSVGPAAVGFPTGKTGINYNGSVFANWPNLNPNQAASAALVTISGISGGLIGIIQTGTEAQRNLVPAGRYWFGTALKSTSTPSGGNTPAGSETGYIDVSLAVDGTYNIFVAYVGDQYAAPDFGKVYIWHGNGATGYWTRVNGTTL